MRNVAAAAFAVVAVLVACSPRSAPPDRVVDAGAAAETARNDIARYATGGRAPTPVATSRPEPDGAAAADSARSYFAALKRGDDGAAATLRDGDGMAAVEAELARLAAWEASVGAPGPVDAGAGQRYVTVPARITGIGRDGARFSRDAKVILHRTADVDGATAAQKSWRIQRIEWQEGGAPG